jgi:putative transposase
MTIRSSYTRHLPHQVPEGFPIFLTWNLKGAMPKAVIEQLVQERQRLEKQAPRPGETIAQRRTRESKMVFAMADRFLDQATDGPMHLKDPRAAKIVEDSIRFGAGDRYDLFAWCIMSNHVHAFLTPHGELREVTQQIKGSTAYVINGLQNARGRVFWQDESYDHWCRDETEMGRIIHYIENNPVAARLCRRPEEWPWSSARFRIDWAPGEAYEVRACENGRQAEA